MAPSARLSATRQTDPVQRGKFVRERVLCQGLDPPPPDLVITPPEIRPGTTARERFRDQDRSIFQRLKWIALHCQKQPGIHGALHFGGDELHRHFARRLHPAALQQARHPLASPAGEAHLLAEILADDGRVRRRDPPGRTRDGLRGGKPSDPTARAARVNALVRPRGKGAVGVVRVEEFARVALNRRGTHERFRFR